MSTSVKKIFEAFSYSFVFNTKSYLPKRIKAFLENEKSSILKCFTLLYKWKIITVGSRMFGRPEQDLKV